MNEIDSFEKYLISRSEDEEVSCCTFSKFEGERSKI